MTNSILKVSLVLLLSAFTLISCNKDNVFDVANIDLYEDDAMYELQRDGNCGKFGCFEFVFPLTIEFEDGIQQEVADYEALHLAIRTWKQANPDSEEKPEFVYPIEVVSEDGELISVADQTELRELASECGRNFFGRKGPRGHRNRGDFCFKLTFPLTIEFPDGTTVMVADRGELKSEIRTWKEANPDAEERPELVFPITVELEDETLVTVNDREELQELKEGCGEDE